MSLGPWTLRETISDAVSIESAPVLRADGSRSGKRHYRVVMMRDGTAWRGGAWGTLHEARSAAQRCAQHGQASKSETP
jgi:hypothetical protein